MEVQSITIMFWQKWHVTILVLLSLLLHGLLLVLATFRNRTANTIFKYSIYGIHLLSTKIAFIAFGFTTAAECVADNHMMPCGLWAAVVLLHLAGQERLSAFDLDENKLWRGTTVSRLWPVLLHLCVFFHGGDLALPTRILFSLALLRLLARALRLSMGTKAVMDLCNDSIDESMFQSINTDDDADDPLIVSRAHCLFKTSHRHLAKIPRSNEVEHQHHQVRAFFLRVTDPSYAIRLVEIELNFLYEAFHTDGTIRKMLNDTYSLLYVVFRIYEFILCLYTLRIYSNIKSQDTYIGVVTNILLGGTVILEVISYILMVFSDWTIASFRSGNCLFRLISKALFQAALHNRRQWWSNYATTHQIPRILFRRWSETISNFKFVRYSKQPQSLGKPLRFCMMRPLDVMTGTQNMYTSFKFVSNVLYSEQLGNFIFQELQNKRNNQQSVTFFEDENREENFNSTVLKWHIITELLYNYQLGDADHQSEVQDNYCRHSKLISDYISYIFFMKLKSGNNPLVKSQTAQLRIQRMPAFPPLVKEDYRTKCKEILNSCLSNESFDDDYYVTSVYCAISTASELIGKREGKIQWKEISEQWVNILVVAARKYKRFDHVRGLCHGGELLSIVWLLAFHLGFYHQESGSSSSSV